MTHKMRQAKQRRPEEKAACKKKRDFLFLYRVQQFERTSQDLIDCEEGQEGYDGC